MKTFLVMLKNKSNEKLQDELLKQHIEHLKELEAQNHLLICGPFCDDSGAMLVLQADSLTEIEKLIQADPFIQDKYYGDYSITEFYKADSSNNYLMDHDQTIDELNRE